RGDRGDARGLPVARPERCRVLDRARRRRGPGGSTARAGGGTGGGRRRRGARPRRLRPALRHGPARRALARAARPPAENGRRGGGVSTRAGVDRAVRAAAAAVFLLALLAFGAAVAGTY